MSSDNRKSGIHIKWKAVSYRSVALMVLAGAVIFFIAVRLTFPQFTANTLQSANDVAGKILEKIGGMAPPSGSGGATAQQAHFTALDGTVRVKKGNGNSYDNCKR